MTCKKNLHMFLKNMNISPVSFCAKHRDIRKADDIMRHSNKCFPMFSPSYAISHWNRFTQNTNQAELERTAFFNKYSKILDEKVRNKYINDDDSYHLNLFEPLKKEKMGNCKENAIALIATLFANGYEKAARIGLEYEINFVDKKTKKVASTSVFNFDHTCVMTTMDNKEKRKKFEDLIIIDGGKGQLSSVMEIFEKIGMENQDVVSLAKRLEEVFKPHQSQPVIFPINSPALYFFQRIRDEAHRFAITYHRNLRQKSATKSILDEIKGLSPKNRDILLHEFKNVRKISQTSAEELAVKIGKRAANAVYRFFNEKKSHEEYA